MNSCRVTALISILALIALPMAAASCATPTQQKKHDAKDAVLSEGVISVHGNEEDFFGTHTTSMLVDNRQVQVTYGLLEPEAHRDRRNELIVEFRKVKSWYDAELEAFETKREDAWRAELEGKYKQLSDQIKPTITELPDMKKRPLLREVPGKPFKERKDKIDHYAYDKSIDMGFVCLVIICPVKAFEDALTGGTAYSTTRRRDMEQYDAEDRAAIEYNDRVREELDELNSEISAHNGRVEEKIQAENKSILEHNRIIQERISEHESRFKKNYGDPESENRVKLDELVGQIRVNLCEIGKTMPELPSHEAYDEYFDELIEGVFEGRLLVEGNDCQATP